MPFITVTYPPKYPLTESEKKWLEKREKWNSKSGYYLTPWAFPNKTLYRVTEYADYRDAAEFEARVALLLAQKYGAWEPCYHSHCTEGADTVADCMECRLKHARLAVEQEMDA